MFSPDTTSSYGTLGILPIDINSNIHHPHHDYNHHNRGSINSHTTPSHRPKQHAFSSPLNLRQHGEGCHTDYSNYIAISSSSASSSNPHPNRALQPPKSSYPATTQVQSIPHSTSTATLVSSHALSLSTTELDSTSWSAGRHNPEFLQQQQLLYQDLSDYLAQTAATTSTTISHDDYKSCTTKEETTYTITAGPQQSTKTSLSTINGTAAQLGGNSYNHNHNNNNTDKYNNTNEYSDMSSDLVADGDFIVRALHEYHTDSEGHLSFSQFQYIKVRHCDVSGWWFGESENNRGWFPSNRVERVAAVYESEVRKTQLCKHRFFFQ